VEEGYDTCNKQFSFIFFFCLCYALRAERKQKEESAQKWPAKQHKNREPLSQYKKKFASEYKKKKNPNPNPTTPPHL